VTRLLTALAVGAFCAALAVAPSRAEEQGHMDHMDMGHDHMAMSMPHEDARRLLDFPDPMRNHMLGNMRGHLTAVGEILAALSDGDGPRAAKIAEQRLGVESPNAMACVKGEAAGGMAAMMAKHMPEEMRTLGMTMHQSASDFAKIAAATAPNGDLRPALASLAKVTEACSACHSAYRLK
jgi:hypothetical protein